MGENKKRGSFRDLRIWKKGFELLMKIYKISKKFPKEEKFNLTSQIRSSANSVIALTTEAHGRYFYKDKRRVLFQSRGELKRPKAIYQ